jgi:hypothetical protein
MEHTANGEGGDFSFIDDDKSDTVMTGFNTDDPLDDYDKFFEEEELVKDDKSAKSDGKEVKIPFTADIGENAQQLDQIIEIEESDISEPESPEK